MKSSLFHRHFLLTAGIILISFALLAASFMILSYRFIVKDQKQSVSESVTGVAQLTEFIMDHGQDPTDETFFSIYAPLISSTSEADALLCSEDGSVVRYIANDPQDPADFVGDTVSASVVNQVASTGLYSGMSDLGIFAHPHFSSGIAVQGIVDGEAVTYLVFMAASAEDLMILWRALATLFFFASVVVLMIAFVSSSIFSLQQIKPLQNMSDVVHRFGMGEYELRVDDCDRTDEIGELARNFNAMADAIASTEQRRQEFVANISHELKTPMTTISGFTNGILDGTIPPEKVQESLQVISSETARLSRLVRQMLDASASQAQGGVQSQVEFDICETMIQVVISLEGKIRSRQLDMDVHIPDDPITVWGDPDSITQVCYNLLDNAAKFATPGTAIGVTITAKGGKAHVSVRNLGETIPPEELSMIFDRFHKSDRSRSIDKEGVGLGLYIVKTILNNHKESITVTSENGVTEFTFTLTLAG